MVELKELKALMFVLTAGILWGSVFPLTKISLRDFAAFDVAFYRAIVASFAMLSLSFRKLSDVKLRKEDVKRIVPLSFVGVIAFYTFLNFGMSYSTPIKASFLVCTYPLFVVLLAPMIVHEKLSLDKVAGVCLGLVGAYLIIGGGQLIAVFDPQTIRGDLILMLASICYAFYPLLTKRLFSNVSLTAEYVTTNIFAFAVAPFLILSVISSNPLKIVQASPFSIIAIVWLGVMGSAVAFLAFNKGLKVLKASTSVIGLLIIPVVSTILSYIIVGEEITTYKILGGILVLMAILMMQLSPRKLLGKLKTTTNIQ
jgi:drug/metabolite transporter (DMT)-like permease